MGEVHYMISETAKRVGMEEEILHYWEEELTLPIGRTEMGHRFYTEDDIQLFCCIKELIGEGIQLKELKNLIPDMLRTRTKLRLRRCAEEQPMEPALPESDQAVVQPLNMGEMAEVLRVVMAENNPVLAESITKSVCEKMVQDIDYLLQAKERTQEEHFRSLDHLIRQHQPVRREAVRTSPVQRLIRLFSEA